MNYSKDTLERMSRTARYAGAVGHAAVVPRHVAQVATRDMTILDYGCGHGQHTKALRALGYNITGYDAYYSQNQNALERRYDIIFASNVINIQEIVDYVTKVLQELHELLKPGGRIYFNYPKSPRKSPLTDNGLERILEILFEDAWGKSICKKFYIIWRDAE